MKQFVFFHIIPSTIAIIAVCFLISIAQFILKNQSNTAKNILIAEDPQQPTFKHFANYEADGEKKIIFLAKALSDKTIVLFGSSELTDDERTPYHFFNDSILKIIGVGHAYNETFAIYCQLLSMGEYARNSNVCIILSAAWFEDGEGTNIQAFLEFVPELMQKRIWSNKIDDEFKYYVYAYMMKHKSEINTLPLTYLLLAKLDYDGVLSNINKMLALKFLPNKVDLKFSISNSSSIRKNTFVYSWDSMLTKDYTYFLTTCDSNKIYVNNKYYFKNLANKDGTIDLSTVPLVPFPNTEMDDLKMLLKLLKHYNCNASFIMEPINPYYYRMLSNYKPVMDSIHKFIVDEYHYPYLNLFVTDTAHYHPGELNDIMHFGRVGWDKVNRFIYETYGNKSSQQ